MFELEKSDNIPKDHPRVLVEEPKVCVKAAQDSPNRVGSQPIFLDYHIFYIELLFMASGKVLMVSFILMFIRLQL